MAPASIPAVRFALSRTDMSTCRDMAAAALAASTPQQGRDAVEALVDPTVLAAL